MAAYRFRGSVHYHHDVGQEHMMMYRQTWCCLLQQKVDWLSHWGKLEKRDLKSQPTVTSSSKATPPNISLWGIFCFKPSCSTPWLPKAYSHIHKRIYSVQLQKAPYTISVSNIFQSPKSPLRCMFILVQHFILFSRNKSEPKSAKCYYGKIFS